MQHQARPLQNVCVEGNRLKSLLLSKYTSELDQGMREERKTLHKAAEAKSLNVFELLASAALQQTL
jgi:hypothetical protein